MPTITTPRLILRPPEEKDLEEVHAAKIEIWDELQLWMSWAFDDQRSIEALKEYFDLCQVMLTEGSMPLIAFTREDNKFAVSTGIHAMEKPKTYNTGYWTAKSLQGQGLATEATNAAIRYAFSVLGAKAIRIFYCDGNEKSRRVIEKLGFEPTETKKEAFTRCLDGTLLDTHEYIMRDPSVLPPLDVQFD